VDGGRKDDIVWGFNFVTLLLYRGVNGNRFSEPLSVGGTELVDNYVNGNLNILDATLQLLPLHTQG
jgi:hypothetical protein